MEYRFDVPNGDYLVLLGFLDAWNHGPGRRVFDVFAEGQEVLPDLDIIREAGGMWRVVEYRFRVTVLDGQLTIGFAGNADSPDPNPTLSAIEVVDLASAQVSGPPAPPDQVRAVGSYGAVDVLWNASPEQDVIGYKVYRAVSAYGPWELVEGRMRVTPAIDDLALPEGGTWFYRVTAVDADGNESAPSAVVSAPSFALAEATLPAFQLTMTESALSALNGHVSNDNYEPAALQIGDRSWDSVQARYRGQIARNFSKKNWKVKVPSDQPWGGRDTFNLNADLWDAFMVRKALAFDLYRDLQVITPDVEPALLTLNGELQGVVQDLEDVDPLFLANHQLDPNAEVFKANWDQGNLTKLDDPALYRTYYSQENGTAAGYERLQQFIDRLNDHSDPDPANTIAEYVNLTDWINYYGTLVFVGENDSEVHNYFLYMSQDDLRWRFIPYDHDLSFGNSPWDPFSINTGHSIDEGTYAHQGIGWNKLIDRYISVKQFRKRHTDFLRAKMDSIFSLAEMTPRIEARVHRVRPEAERDTNKFPLEDNTPISQACERLKGYVTDRKANLEYQMANGPGGTGGAFELPSDFRIYINEFMTRNTKTLGDEAGDFDPWVELYNSWGQPVDIGGMYLSDDSANPTKYQIPAGTTVPGNGFLLIWCDNETTEGPLHANFRLTPSASSVILTSKMVDGKTQTVQSTAVPSLLADESHGMKDDGLYRWRRFPSATPGASNSGGAINEPPVVKETYRTPAYPQANEVITVTTRVTDDRGLNSVTLYYRGKVAVWQNVALLDDGLHGDGAAGDGVFGGTIPGQPAGVTVNYYVKAVDTSNQGVTDPRSAPSVFYKVKIGDQPPQVRLNELMADNTTVITDEAGEYEDWVEIVNLDSRTIDLSGMFLTDDPAVTNQWKFPAGSTLAPGARILVWCDNDTEQGRYHTNFKLSASGEYIALHDVEATGRLLIDSHPFGTQKTNWSEGRYPDGTGSWAPYFHPSPNAVNPEPDNPPRLTGTSQTPTNPSQVDTVTVTSSITDDHHLNRTELFVDSGSGFAAQTMFDDGLHGDGAAGDGRFGAFISPKPAGTVVKYYIEAADNGGNITRDPAAAPTAFFSYSIGYNRPSLFINEFLADNKKSIKDEAGEAEDWIEIYNGGAADLDLGGMYLTDDLANPIKWQIPSPTVLAAGDFLIFWADSEPADGRLHTNFGLSKGGEAIGLFDTDANGRLQIDAFTFGTQTTDRSTGRMPDAGATWQVFTTPTPNAPNDGLPAVTGVAAHAYNTVIDLTWNAHPSADILGYEILAADAADRLFTKIHSGLVEGRFFRDLGLTNGKARFYKVRAVTRNGRRSADPAPVSATPQTGMTTPVTDLRLTLEGDDVILRWTTPTNDPPLSRVEIFRDDLVLIDADVDAGQHLYGLASEPGQFRDPGERRLPNIRFYQVRPVDSNELRATE